MDIKLIITAFKQKGFMNYVLLENGLYLRVWLEHVQMKFSIKNPIWAATCAYT